MTQAAELNLGRMVEFLATTDGIDLNETNDPTRNSVLEVACVYNRVDIIKNLLGHPQLDINRKIPDSCGLTLFQYAYDHRKDIFKLLLENSNLNPNVKDNSGMTIRMRACRIGDREAVDLLLKHPRIDLNVKDNSGMTALMIAFQ